MTAEESISSTSVIANKIYYSLQFWGMRGAKSCNKGLENATRHLVCQRNRNANAQDDEYRIFPILHPHEYIKQQDSKRNPSARLRCRYSYRVKHLTIAPVQEQRELRVYVGYEF
jgi:hypothetical protein